jgi:hypothetical protein
MSIFGKPANQYSQIAEENLSTADPKKMLEDGRRILRMAEKAENEGDLEKAQIYRRILGD